MFLTRKQQQPQESERDLVPHSYRRALTRTLTSPCSAIFFTPLPLAHYKIWGNDLEEGSLMLRTNASGVQPLFRQRFLAAGPAWLQGHHILKWQPWAWWPMQTPKSYADTGTLHRIVKKPLVWGEGGRKGENNDLLATMTLHIYFVFEGYFPQLYFRINFNHRIQYT